MKRRARRQLEPQPSKPVGSAPTVIELRWNRDWLGCERRSLRAVRLDAVLSQAPGRRDSLRVGWTGPMTVVTTIIVSLTPRTAESTVPRRVKSPRTTGRRHFTAGLMARKSWSTSSDPALADTLIAMAMPSAVHFTVLLSDRRSRA
jgi:hypothetical protein